MSWTRKVEGKYGEFHLIPEKILGLLILHADRQHGSILLCCYIILTVEINCNKLCDIHRIWHFVAKFCGLWWGNVTFVGHGKDANIILEMSGNAAYAFCEHDNEWCGYIWQLLSLFLELINFFCSPECITMQFLNCGRQWVWHFYFSLLLAQWITFLSLITEWICWTCTVSFVCTVTYLYLWYFVTAYVWIDPLILYAVHNGTT